MELQDTYDWFNELAEEVINTLNSSDSFLFLFI